MMRVVICILAVIAYFVWVGMYIAPHAQEAVFSDVTLRRIVHAGIPF